MEEDDESFDLVASHFERVFDLSVDRESTLSEEKYLEEFKEQQEQIEREVNEVKETISELCREPEDRRKWRMNTQKTHLMGGLSRRLGRRHSNAFCKFWQILVAFPELVSTRRKKGRGGLKSTTFRSLHLCEVPGHFLSSIDHFLALFFPRLRWTWMANSLNPHYEHTKAADMFLEDQLIVDHPQRWLFGTDNSGDVTKLAASLRQSRRRFDLVTADGSTYSLDHPEDQEALVLDILRGEVECALASLREGGALVIKVYSSFLPPSARLFSLLRALFARCCLAKPPSSKSGNTERYLVCTGFRRKASRPFNAPGALEEYMSSGVMTRADCESLLASSRFFSGLQTRSMENNIELFVSPSMNEEEVNILVDRAIERVMRDCLMHLIRDAEIASSLFVAREFRPWTSLFRANHVERLKQLEEPARAEEFLREKQVGWLMGDKGGAREDALTEVEWMPEEMRRFDKGDSYQIVVPAAAPTLAESQLHHLQQQPLHSLFIDPDLWVALRALQPERIVDACRNDMPMSETAFMQWIAALPRDDRGFLQISLDALPSRLDWLRLLLVLLSQLGLGTLRGLQLRLPEDSQDAPLPLFLSRFSASLLALLSCLFFRLHIPHPEVRAPTAVTFDLPNYPEDIPQSLCEHLRALVVRMSGEHVDCLSFAPLSFMAELHPLIAFYNNGMLKRAVCERLR